MSQEPQDKIREFFQANPGKVTTRAEITDWLQDQGIRLRNATLHEQFRLLMADGSIRQVAHGRYSGNVPFQPWPAPARPDTAPAALVRASVSFIRPVQEDLAKLVDWTGYNQTDIINRAITVYRMIEESRRAGDELVFRNKETGKERIVEII